MLTTLPTESQRYRESGVLTIPLKLCDPHGANLRPSLVPVELYILFGIYIYPILLRTGVFGKKCPTHLVSLIKVEGLFVSYIVSIFDIVNSETLV